jgi:Kef-type K+ transport system membrane component KefB
MIEVDAESFLVITGAALVAAITFAALPSRIVPPVVVLELLLGILIGPQVLGLAQSDGFTDILRRVTDTDPSASRTRSRGARGRYT